MAELASGLAGKVLELLASSAYEEIKQAWGVSNDLEKLRRTTASIQAVLLDAEEKQVHNRALTFWLDQLKAALYDVEDILTDFQSQHLRSKVLGLSRWSFPKKTRIIGRLEDWYRWANTNSGKQISERKGFKMVSK